MLSRVTSCWGIKSQAQLLQKREPNLPTMNKQWWIPSIKNLFIPLQPSCVWTLGINSLCSTLETVCLPLVIMFAVQRLTWEKGWAAKALRFKGPLLNLLSTKRLDSSKILYSNPHHVFLILALRQDRCIANIDRMAYSERARVHAEE